MCYGSKWGGFIFFSSGITAGLEHRLRIGECCIRIVFPPFLFAEGRYTIDIMAARTNSEFLVYAESAVAFSIVCSDPGGTGLHFRQGNGSVYIPCRIEMID